MATSQTQLEILIKAQDEASAKIDAIAKRSEGLGGTMKKLGGVMAGVFASKQVFDWGKQALQAFADAEKSTARVNATLATMGSVGEKAKDAIQKLSNTAESVTKLFQRTGDLTKAQELNALAMDLSRAKNIDLGTATDLVGQVLAGNGKVLKQYGIDIKDTATPLEALGLLHDKVAGQAAAFADTTAGRMEVLNILMGNVQETFGGALADGLKPFMDTLMTLVQDPTVIAFIQTLATVISTVLVSAFTFLKWYIDSLTLAFQDMFTLWDNITGFISSVFNKAIESIGDAFLKIYEPIKKVYDVLSNVVSKAIEATKYVGNKVVGAVAGVFSGKAVGGTVMAGQSYMVGERGAEMFTPMQSGSITPNGALAGGGSIVVNINGGTYLSESVAQDIGDMIIDRFKRSVRI
jgi:phage-related protein